MITLGHYCVHFVLGASTKRHVYWAMKNCGGDGEALKRLIENVVSHYKVTYLFSIYQFELLYVELCTLDLSPKAGPLWEVHV